MKKMIKHLSAIFCLSFITTVSLAQNTSQRTKYNFNSDWKVIVGDPKEASNVSFNDGSWKSVTLPYAWNEDEAFKKDIVDLSTGISWYRKRFKLPASAKGQKVFLEFEGIRQAGDFYVNGTHVGLHENGVTSFGFDVTELVKFGDEENVVAARIDNDWNYREKATNTKFQWEDKNFNVNYGGITKNVYLHIVPKVYQTLPLYSNLKTTGVYVYALNHNIKGETATIHAESEVKNETAQPQQVIYEVSIKELDDKLLKTFVGDKVIIAPNETKVLKASSAVSGLKFWSWGYGYLYNVTTTLKVNGKPTDAVTTTTGFRKTDFKDGMIYLNDRVIMVHGYAQRTTNEWPAVGASIPAWLSDYSNALMVESGGNLVRWMHIAPWKQDVESCDRVGLLQAMPAGDAEKDVEGTRWEQRKAVMRDAIIYNKNNPSIIFYECGNESISEQHMQEMKDIRDQYDPKGGRAIGSREMLDSKTAEYGGEMLYTNKSAHIPMWAMEYSRDEGSRKYWDDFTPPYHKDGAGPLHKGQSAAAYNRNMESHAVENVRRWYEFWKERPGTGKRLSSGGVNIIWSETNTHHRGEENFRRSGEVDAMRIKKQNYYSHKVMWDGWVNPEKHSLHIVGHWNYDPSVKKDIYVISTSDKVELKVNGKSKGFGKKSDGFLFTFKNIEWVPGNISAVGYDAKNKQVCTGIIHTVGAPVALRLTKVKRPTEFVANGHDLALVEVEVVDAKGNRCPTALNMVNYTMTGPGEWRGGMAMGPGNYVLTTAYPVEGGVNRFLVRSTTQPGTITVKATAEGLKDATITLNTKPYATENGLSAVLPSAGLPMRLDRGPTPATPSYTMTRTPLTIVSATAGANADKAARSFDDNELSDWVNDGKLNTAWIEYTLEKEATVSEITIKLNNFRSRVYPLVITVDGKEAFNGKTQTTLGYYTISLKPTRGKTVRIQLAGTSLDQGTNTGVEVNGKKLDDGVARDDANAKGTLSIIEAEIYAPLSAAKK
ncbi:glycoside hydrolase family 2 protein [Aridibaculum aurantiacum]|uniref:glycoside hydrolase family 2 protein n=1 Tax=Aridibaculum aurantiacum TaxID=2810307 RepID=UPI001A96D62C|nr:sugar-binding domain-containing protein [Aridibaculum aurantiacum]